MKLVSAEALDEAGLLESGEGAVFVDRLEGFAGGLDLHVASELRYEDTLGVQVGGNLAFHGLGDVTTDAAFFLGETGTVNFAAGADAGTSDTTNAGHDIKGKGLRGRGEKPPFRVRSRIFDPPRGLARADRTVASS